MLLPLQLLNLLEDTGAVVVTDTVTPRARMLVVGFEDRGLVVAHENRVMAIQFDDRTMTVPTR